MVRSASGNAQMVQETSACIDGCHYIADQCIDLINETVRTEAFFLYFTVAA